MLAVVLSCSLASLSALALIPVDRLPDGFGVHTCYKVSTTSGIKVSGWWLSPHLKGAPQWAYTTAAYPNCATVPWLPFLPQSGQLSWP